jgi:hypothetical protein
MKLLFAPRLLASVVAVATPAHAPGDRYAKQLSG